MIVYKNDNANQIGRVVWSRAKDDLQLLTRFGAADSSEWWVEAARDDERSDRPWWLTDDQLTDFKDTFQDTRKKSAMTHRVHAGARQAVYYRELGFGYSEGSCRRFLKVADLSYQIPWGGNAKTDPTEQDAFREKFQKLRTDGCHSILY